MIMHHDDITVIQQHPSRIGTPSGTPEPPGFLIFVLDLVLNGGRNGLILRSAVSGQNDQTAAQGRHVTDGQRHNIVGLASIGGLDDAIDKLGEFVVRPSSVVCSSRPKFVGSSIPSSMLFDHFGCCC
jgi:hypothetical protein